MPKIHAWTLSGDTRCRFCGYEDHLAVTLTEPPPDAPPPLLAKPAAVNPPWLPDFTVAPPSTLRRLSHRTTGRLALGTQ